MSLILTLVRHGESTDNLKSLWAGHRDAPLTSHGMNQARRLGKSFEDVAISKIYASDLKRAHWTALQIATQNRSLLDKVRAGGWDGTGASSGQRPNTQTGSTLASEGGNDLDGQAEEEIVESEPGPSSIMSTDRQTHASAGNGNGLGSAIDYEDDFSCSSSAAASSPVPSPSKSAHASSAADPAALLAQTVTTTPLLREQFFGRAEGQNWKTGYATSSNSFHNRNYCFDQGESLEDVGRRATEIMQRVVVPHLVKAAKTGQDEHVVLVAHGIMISELLFALSRLQDPRALYERRSGHTNTGWTRITLKFSSPASQQASSSSSLPLSEPDFPCFTATELPPAYVNCTPSAPTALPSIGLRQTHTNITTHLNGLKRTKGGVGSEGFDARQKSLKDFFGGGSAPAADDEASGPMAGGSATPVDLTKSDGEDDEDKSMKTNGEAQKRGIRLKSPPSPSPKKGRLT